MINLSTTQPPQRISLWHFLLPWIQFGLIQLISLFKYLLKRFEKKDKSLWFPIACLKIDIFESNNFFFVLGEICYLWRAKLWIEGQGPSCLFSYHIVFEKHSSKTDTSLIGDGLCSSWRKKPVRLSAIHVYIIP